MSIITHTTDVYADLEKVCSVEQPDLALLGRIKERSENVQDAMRRLGQIDIAVPLLREVRSEA